MDIKHQKYKRKKKKNNSARIYFSSISITTAIFFALIVSGGLFVRGVVKPPDIPADVIASTGDTPYTNMIANANTGINIDKTSSNTNIAQNATQDTGEGVKQNINADERMGGNIDVAHSSFEGEEEDAFIGNGLRAPEGFTEADRKEQFYTFLIFGMDGGINTDTIMVASYDGISKKANIVAIPRDSKVNVKRNVKKINAAYTVGTLGGAGVEGGIEQLKRELKTIIGFIPDFYVGINLDAFTQMVDAVGGIEVDVPYDMVYDDPDQGLHINIKKGLNQKLSGEDALKFARYRKSNDLNSTITDYQRIENQQAIIKAVLSNLLKPSNILKIPEFINIFNENVYSNIKPENMLWFADQLNRINGTDSLNSYTLPTTGTSGEPMYYEFLDEPGIVELINYTINPYTKTIGAKDLDIAENN